MRAERRDSYISLARLAAVDATSAAKLERNDYRRLVRALEIHAQTGKPRSHFATEPDAPYDARVVNIAYASRMQLYRVVDARCEVMLQGGLFDEVLGLLAAGRFSSLERPFAGGAGAIGYAHCLDFLRGRQFRVAPFVAMLERFQADTRRLSRRQLAYWRHSSVGALHMRAELGQRDDEPLVAQLVGVTRMDRADFERLGRGDEERDEEAALREYASRQLVFDAKSARGLAEINRVLSKLECASVA